jgi:acyl transferase domain-containing protein/NADPH:quinone reductase-like Zn-dependent oxidoreductase/thioesterase domain-containing protein/SAM-dependent methyltransferase
MATQNDIPAVKRIVFRMVADRELGAAEAASLLQRLKQEESSPAPAIAVIGMAGRFGNAGDLDALWRLIEAGGDCLVPMPVRRWGDGAPGGAGGFLPDEDQFDPLFFRISPTEAALMDPQQRVFLEQAYLAFEDAGYGEALLAGTRCGVYVGAGAADYAHRFQGTADAANPLGLMGNVSSILAARISYFLNLKGPSLALDTACSSSLVAVHLACEALRAGHCDMALAGGVAVISTASFVEAMGSGGAISRQSCCRSFDAAADGFACGEGAGAVILKRLPDALRDGDRILGVIRGSGINQDGRTNGITAPSGPAQAALEAEVYRRSGVDPATISYVETHGTGTVLGDPIEIEGLTEAFRGWTRARGFCAIGSIKPNIGHALTAAGIAGLLKVLLMLRHGLIPPLAHFDQPNPRIDFAATPFFVPREAVPWPGVRRAAISSFGFSGTNAHLVVEAAPAPSPRSADPASRHLFVLSAKSATALARTVSALAAHLAATPALEPRDVAFTLALGRGHYAHRLAIVAETIAGLTDLLARAARGAGDEAILAGRLDGDAGDPGPAPEDIHALARYWVAGGAIDWAALFADAAPRRVALPTYPLERASYGVPLEPRAEEGLARIVAAVAAVEERADAALAHRGAGFAAVEDWGRRRLLAAYAELGLHRSGRRVFTPAGLVKTLGIVPAKQKLHAALVGMLVRSGAFRIEDELIRLDSAASLPPAALAEERIALAAREPALGPFFDLLAACLEGLPALLTGRRSATEILFPDGRTDLVERVYQGNELADHFNRILAAAVVAGASGRARILEVGAGTGGATAGILEALKAAGLQADYTYTDISAAFLQHGRKRFPDLTFASFDLGRDIDGQGLAGGFDLVVASNVVHAMPSVAAALARLHRLMAPGGLLVLNEVTAVQDFATLTFGLTDGWWAFEDPALRLPDAPLLDAPGWQRVLAQAGFPASAAFGLPGETDPARFGQSIIVARRDRTPAAVIASPERSEPLPAVAVPRSRGAIDPGLAEVITRAVAEALSLPVEQIDPRGRFMDYGIDSILGAQLVSRLNARLGLDLRPTVLFDHPSVADLARHLGGMAPSDQPLSAPATADRRIAIVGLAGRFADCPDLAAFQRMLEEGRSGITEVPPERWTAAAEELPPELEAAAPFLRWGGFLQGADRFDPLFFRISGKEAELTDPQHRVFLTEAWRALEDAGYGEQALDGRRCGVFVGAHGGDYTHRMAQLGIVPEAFAFMGNAASILAARIAYVLNLKGPCLAVDTACSSSLVAVHLACRSLLDGECDMALAGGVFLTTTVGFNTAAAGAGMLSRSGRCRTFDAAADGFVPGEGVGVVVLKPYAKALAEGDHIEAVILASAVNQDGKTNGITAPSADSQAAVETEAYRQAGIDPSALGYIEAHGTGTPLGDPIEVEGLTRAFRRWTDRRGFCALGSVKTNIGHAAHAAGIAGLIKAVLSLRSGQLFPSLHFRTENPVLHLAETPFRVNTALAPWPEDGRPRRAAVSSFGFSGTNAHIVLEAGPPPPSSAPTSPPFLILVSARSAPALRRRLADLRRHLAEHPVDLADLSRTLAEGRGHFARRWAAVVADRRSLEAALAEGEASNGQSPAPDRLDDGGPAAARPAQLAGRYLAGEDLDYGAIEPAGRRVSLPTYPFEEQSYWLAAALPEPGPARAGYFAPRWEPAAASPSLDGGGVLWLMGDDPAMAAGGDWRVVTIERGAGFARLGPDRYCVDTDRREDLAALLAAAGPPDVVVLVRPAEPRPALEGLRALTALLPVLLPYPTRVLYFHRGRAEDAAASAFGRSLAFVGGRVELRTIETGPGRSVAEILAAELGTAGAGAVRWTGGGREGRRVAAIAAPAASAVLRSGGTFLITGGGGTLAALVARMLARRTRGRIALVGRSPRSELITGLLHDLAGEGGDGDYWQADVTDPTDLGRAIVSVRTRFGPIHGAIHAAGVPGTTVLAEKEWEEVARVLAPKLAGTRALDQALGAEKLDFLALFSSLAAELGDFGQGDYAVGNAFLAAFAAERAARRATGERYGATVAFAWPLWREGRTVLSAEGQEIYLRSAGIPFLETDQGLQALLDGLALDLPELVVVPGDPAVAGRLFAPPAPRASRARFAGATPAPTPAPRLVGRHEPLVQAVEGELIGLVSTLLKIDRERIEPEAGLAEFGFDSIALKDFAQVLGRAYGVSITPAVFFAHGTIAALARHLLSEHGSAIAARHVAEETPKLVAAAARDVLPAPNPAGPGGIAIIGMAGRFPGSPDLDTFWRHLEAGDDLVGPWPEERWSWQPAGRAAIADGIVLQGGFLAGVDRFDPGFFKMSPREAMHLDPQHRLALETAWHCVESAGLAMTDLAGQPIGVFFGQQVNDYASLMPSNAPARAQIALGNIAALLPNRISWQFDFRGPSEAIDTACSSALVAVHRAVQAIEAGECTMALAGGVSLMLSLENLLSTAQLGVLSAGGRCRSFDAAGDGYVKGEGVGAVLLKPLARALLDGDPIRAVILGSAENHGGRAHSLTAPNAAAQSALIVAALARAGVASDTIGYVEAHGTGTELGDPVEALALKTAFTAASEPGAVLAPRCLLGTVKTNIGHLEPASGIAGLIKTVLALEHRVIPGSLNYSTLNPHIDFTGTPFAVATGPSLWPRPAGAGGELPRRAGVSSFGFGGSNAHIVLQEAPDPATAPVAAVPLLLPLSARDPDRLAAAVRDLALFLRDHIVTPADLARTLQQGRVAMPARLAFVWRPGQDLPERLADALAVVEQGVERDEVWLGTAAVGATDQGLIAALGAERQLGRLAALWVKGAAIDWRDLDLAPGGRRVALPGYPFERQPCWFERAAAESPPPEAPRRAVEPSVPARPVVAPAPAAPTIVSSDRSAIRTQLIEMVARALYLAPEAVDPDMGLGDLGLDSILAVELTRDINQAFGTSLQAPRLYDHATVAALADHIAGAAVAPSPVAANPSAPAPSAPPVEPVFAQLRALLAAALYLDEDAIDPHAGFGDLGLDSILAVELTKSINDRFAIGLQATRLYDHADLSALAAYVAGRLGTSAAALPGPAAGVLAFLVARIAEAAGLPEDQFGAATPLESIALEPAQAMALLARANQEFGTTIAPDAVGRCRDLGTLAALFVPPAPSIPAPAPAPMVPPPASVEIAPAAPVAAAPSLPAPGVAVIGLACRFPGALDAESFWANLRDGVAAITAGPIEPWRAEIYRSMLAEAGKTVTTWGGFIAEADRFDPLFFNLSPKEAALMDPQQRLFLEIAWHALEDAGQTPQRLGGTACGIFVGAGQGDYSQILPREAGQISGQMLLGNTGSILASRLAYFLNLKGPSLALDTACSSALVATHLAWKSILDGECTVALAGGINLMLTPQMHLLTGASGMLAADGRCKTFDNAADGFVPGEGIGVVVLKRLDLALADGDRIYAVIEGSGINQDGKTSSITAPSAKSQAELEAGVHERFAIPVDRITLVEAHGTGTKLGDPIEIDALAEAFGRATERRQFCTIGSVKTNIGHTLAAAGVAGLIKLLQAFEHRQIPPSLNFATPNDHIEFARTPFRIAEALTEWPAPPGGRRLAALNSFGFSGTNAHLVLGEPPPGPAAAEPRPFHLVVLSAKTRAALARQRAGLARRLAASPDLPLADIAYTLAVRRAHFGHRLAFVVADLAELRAALADLPIAGSGDEGAAAVQARQIDATGPKAALDALAERYRSGGAVDWAGLYPSGRVVSLPGYAFERGRYWPEFAQAPEIRVLRRTLSPDDPVVEEHRIAGRPVLPGAAIVGLLNAAAQSAPAFRLRNLTWLRPIQVDRPVELVVSVRPGADGWSAAIEADGVLHAAAEGDSLVPAAAAADLAAIRGRCRRELATADLDALFGAAGITYGPGFRLIAAVWRGDDEVLARIEVPAGDEPFPAEPLDAALRSGAALALGAEPGPAMLPYAVEELVAHGPLRGAFWSHVTVDRSRSTATEFRCDVSLLDDTGSVLMRVVGFRARPVSSAPADSALLYLRPRWRSAPAEAAAGVEPVLVLHGTEEADWAAAYAATLAPRPARLVSLDPGIDETSVGNLLEAAGPVGEVLFCAWRHDSSSLDRDAVEAANRRGVRLLLALLRRLAQGPAVRLKIVTRGIQRILPEDRTDAAFAALIGMAGTAARELPRLGVSIVDLPAAEREAESLAHTLLLAREPAGEGAVVAYRGGRRYRQALERIVPPAPATPILGRGGACLIIGGAGGLGVETSRWLAARAGARIVWVGRRPADARIEQAAADIRAAGGAVRYVQADASDAAALAAVLDGVERDWGPVELVIHAALVLRDRTLAAMSEADLAEALAPKVLSAVALGRALAGRDPARILVFSSANSFTCNPGQANYAAGCSFIDAWARQQAETTGQDVRIVNWGFWGDVGAVADEAHRLRAERAGVAPIRIEEGMAALARLFRGPVTQAAVLKFAAEETVAAAAGLGAPLARVPAELPPAARMSLLTAAGSISPPPIEGRAVARRGMETLIAYGGRQLWTRLRAAGLLPPGRHAVAALAARCAVVPEYERLWGALLDLLARNGLVGVGPGSVDIPGSDPDALPPPAGDAGVAAPLALLDAALAGVADVLVGRRTAAEVLFPAGSTALVEALYRDNPLSDRFNRQLAGLAAALACGPAPLRVLEIGAGTGGASAAVLDALAASGTPIRYFYTDLSVAFLTQAERRFGRHGFVEYRPLDIERDPSAQGFPPGSFDLVIASNVLHATTDIGVTLGHAKTLLVTGGVLLLNEITTAADFATLTFGLTPGWWAFRDPWRRLPLSPALDLAGWGAALAEAGFDGVTAVGADPDDPPEQCVILAASDGWIAPATTRSRPIPEARPAPATAAAGTDYLAGIFGEILHLPPGEIDPREPYDRYGVDSLVIQELRNRLEQDLGPLSPTLLMEHASLSALDRALRASHGPALERLSGAGTSVSEPPPPARVEPDDTAVAVIGIAGRYPGAPDIGAFWELLLDGRSAIGEVPAERWEVARYWDPTGRDPGKSVGKWGGFLDRVDGFDPLFFGISPAEAAAIDPQERLFLETAWAVLEDAGYTRARLGRATGGRVGLFVGASSADYLRLGTEAWRAGDAAAGGSAFWSIANRASFLLDFHGPSLAVDTACSSSLTAIHLAVASLASGECAAAIAGGVHLILHPRSQVGLSQLGLLSPSGACHSFGEAADGLVEGEGVGALLLRPLGDAVRDGDRIYGVIRGSAISSSGRTSAYMLPNPAAQADVIRAALARAGVAAETIGWVEAQAVGSPIADPVEIAGLGRVFAERREAGCAIGSLKPNIGHLEAASGVAQATKALLQLHHRRLAPTIGTGRLNPNIDFAATPFEVQRVAAPWPERADPRRAAVSSFGAGGANAHLILEEGPPEPVGTPVAGPFLFPLSARTPERLALLAERLRTALEADPALPLDRVAWTLQLGREAMAVRRAITAGDRAALRDQLAEVAAGRGRAVDEIGRRWETGAEIDWAGLWSRPCRPVSLPTYPFERRSCWLAKPAVPAAPVPKTRWALVVEGPGEIADLVIRELPVEPLGADEILVRTEAFALNFADVLCAKGLYPNLPPYPFVPGFEIAGTVVAVGAAVAEFVPGDAVIALTGGAGGHATLVAVKAGAAIRKPDEIDFAAAAASPVGILTVRQAFDRAGLEAGETVLIHSAAGGVGLYAVQMAQRRGARIIAVAGSAEKIAHLRELGVEAAVNYREEDFDQAVRRITAGRGVDVVLNTLSGDAIQKGIDLLAPGGRYVEIALTGLKTAGRLDLSRLVDNQSLITVNLGRLFSDPAAARRALEGVARVVSDRTVTPMVGRRFAFTEVHDAYRWLESRRSIGKIVVTVDPEALGAAAQSAADRFGPNGSGSPVRDRRLDGDFAPEAVEARVAALVAETFQLEPSEIGPERNLGEMGLNSVSGVAIMRRIRTLFDVALPVGALWEHPSVAGLTRLVLAARPAASPNSGRYDPVVAIRTGGRRHPSFWVHGAPGEIGWVVELARLLGPDFPVFGLEARGLDGTGAPADSVTAMAEDYVGAVLQTQPNGPYCLGGYSGGGVIAFEMARQLTEAGHSVARLVLLDAPAPGTGALAGMDSAYGEGFIFQLAGNWFAERWGVSPPILAADLAGLDRAQALEHVVSRLAAETGNGHGAGAGGNGRSPEGLRRYLAALDRVGSATGAALRDYVGLRLDTPIETVLFRCCRGMTQAGGRYHLPEFAGAGDYLAGWDDLLATPIRTVPVECDHFALMSPPWSSRVAAEIAALADPVRPSRVPHAAAEERPHG